MVAPMIRPGLFVVLFACLVLEPAAAEPQVPPELPASVYRERRDRLMQSLGPCAAALRSVPGAGGLDPYFFYLTGLEEPGAILVLGPREPVFRQSIYLTPRDPELEVWEGYREPMSPALRDRYQVDEVSRARGPVPRALFKALRRGRCYAALRPAFAGVSDVAPDALAGYLSALSARTEQRWEQLERMRAIKDAEELLRLERAIAITSEGHREAVRALRPGAVERVVAARIENTFFANGATGVAFPSIVGSGPNGAILHWRARDRAVADGDLVVVDIGASYGHYAADITRTYPVSGSFSDEQRAVYEVVLRAQQRALDAVRPGVSLDRLHVLAEEVIVEAGYELPHRLGHFVGLEVHDVGDTGAPLEEGMVITIEPGIYLPGGFGVRIEDMVLVTARGGRLLSGELPRAPAEVEAWMAQVRATP
jgi:Xaa-Pro aminopeptidase